MHWRHWNYSRHVTRWLVVIGSLTACHPISGNQYFCPPTIAHDQTGAVRTEVYAIDRTCYKSMTTKLQACYADAH